MPSPFVLDGILTTSGDGSSGGDVTVPINYVTDNNQGTIFTFSPDPSVDTESSPFRFTALSFTSGNGSKNFVTRMGHNVAPGGGQLDAARPMVAIEQEQRYHDGGQYAVEFHLSFQRPGASLQRWFSGFFSENAPTRTNNYLNIKLEQVYMTDVAGNYLFTCDRTEGLWVRDMRIAITNFNVPTSNLLVMDASPTSSGNYLTLAKNNTAWGYINQYGETILNGASAALSGAGTGQLGFFEVQGRTNTPSTVVFRSVDGIERFNLANNGSYLILSPSVTYQRGAFYCQTSGGTTQFAIDNGRIWTNQTSAASTPDTVILKLPIYNQAGTLLGYIPVYDDIT